MNLTDKLRTDIDAMPYEELLRAWRHTPSGAPLFEGESGKYFADVLAQRKREIGPECAAGISKALGW